MNNQLKKLVADFGGTHLRIGVSNGLEINNISKIAEIWPVLAAQARYRALRKMAKN